MKFLMSPFLPPTTPKSFHFLLTKSPRTARNRRRGSPLRFAPGARPETYPHRLDLGDRQKGCWLARGAQTTRLRPRHRPRRLRPIPQVPLARRRVLHRRRCLTTHRRRPHQSQAGRRRQGRRAPRPQDGGQLPCSRRRDRLRHGLRQHARDLRARARPRSRQPRQAGYLGL